MAAKKKDGPAEGWARVLVSSWDDEREEFYFAATSKGAEVARIYGEFYVEVPVTPKAQAEAMSGAATTFQVGTGAEDKLKVSGPEAPAARKFYADRLEPVRGELRSLGENGVEVTPERFQAMLDEYMPYTGRGGRKAPSVSEDELKGAESTEDLIALLKARGIAVS